METTFVSADLICLVRQCSSVFALFVSIIFDRNCLSFWFHSSRSLALNLIHQCLPCSKVFVRPVHQCSSCSSVLTFFVSICLVCITHLVRQCSSRSLIPLCSSMFALYISAYLVLLFVRPVRQCSSMFVLFVITHLVRQCSPCLLVLVVFVMPIFCM